jgi:D-serine deaminase-like pyridoxal phosphate-dependent protein
MQDAQSLSTFLKPYNARFRVFVDSLTQIHALHEYAESQSQLGNPIVWSVMIKLDGGNGRAGLTLESEDLKRAIGACLDSPYVDLFGFYAHFGREPTSSLTFQVKV